MFFLGIFDDLKGEHVSWVPEDFGMCYVQIKGMYYILNGYKMGP